MRAMPPSLPDAGSINVTGTLKQAIALHGQGRLADAVRLYAVILTAEPGHAGGVR
jgi:hypothetical protein